METTKTINKEECYLRFRAMKISFENISGLLFVLALVIGIAACDTNNADDEATTAQFEVTIENTGTAYPIIKSGAFDTGVNATEPGGIGPGGAFEFEFTAPVGARLSLATMFVQSNDWVYATPEAGVALYNGDGSQVTGNITAEIDLYDVGTEEDQEPGVGDNQVLRQSEPNTGPVDDNNTVREVTDSNLPADEEVIQVTLTSTGTYGFRVRIENVSTASTLQTSQGDMPVPLSPGAWLVHSADQSSLLYTEGEADYGEGLEAIAEDGNPTELAGNLDAETGITVPLSPGAFAVYSGDNPIFTSGQPAPDNGLEAIAEDGVPTTMAAALSSNEDVTASGAFAQPVGASENGPLLPGSGSTYTFSFTAEEGDVLSFATMYIQSNDLFYAPVQAGVDLFAGGTPLSGDISSQLRLWDAGTEANEEPGIGGNQVIRQSGSDTGPADDNTNVREVDDGFEYGDVESHIQVTVRVIQ